MEIRKNGIFACLIFVIVIALCFCVVNQANAYYYGGTGLLGGLYGGIQYSSFNPLLGTYTSYSYSPGLLGGLYGGLYGGLGGYYGGLGGYYGGLGGYYGGLGGYYGGLGGYYGGTYGLSGGLIV